MPTLPPLFPTAPAAAPRAPAIRIEYLDFRNLDEQREFRFRVGAPDGMKELRFRIDLAAFAAGGVRMQDGPEVCYQKLLGAGVGVAECADVMTIDAEELARYRELHTKVPKRRASSNPPVPPVRPPAPVYAIRTARPPVVAPAVSAESERGLDVGQRVRHAAFGLGVTTSSTRSHTVVCFDDDGSKTFVASLLKVDILSAPRTWETSPRGRNRERRTP